MITRKRQPSPSREAEQRPLKRPRHISDSQPTSQEVSVFSRSSRATSGSTSYPIKAIVAERSKEFLVDWADDPITGKSFSPSWQPKRNVSIEAINTWRKVFQTTNPRSAIQLRTTRSPRNITKDRAIARLNTKSPRRQRSHIHPIKPSAPNPDRNTREAHGVAALVDPSSLHSQPNLLVQISQHSSFDREQYLQYHSSLSVNSVLSSLPPHQDSGLGESSPPPDPSHLELSPQIRIVPDSQSLPASSSYVPTPSFSDENIGASPTTGFRESTYISTSFDQDTGLLTEDEFLSSDPIEDSTGFYVAESPEYTSRFRRSRSVPTQNSIELTFSISSRATLAAAVPRSLSDPNLLFSSLESLKDLSDEQKSPDIHSNSSQKNSPIQDRQQSLGGTSGIPSAAQSLVESSKKACSRCLATTRCRHRAKSTDFVILDDFVADSQPTQTTESSVLSQRHPNSQPDRPTTVRGPEPNNDSRKSSSNSPEVVTLSSIPISASGPPPPAPALNTMSQQSSTQLGAGLRASSETPRPGLREKLKNLRAGSRIEADGRRLNKRDTSHSQSSSAVKELAVRSNLSQQVFTATSPSAQDQESAMATGTLHPIPWTQKNPTSPSGPTPAVPTSFNEAVTSSDYHPLHVGTAKESALRTGTKSPGQSRFETQSSEVAANVPLPLHFHQSVHTNSTAPDGPPSPEELSALSQVVTSLQPSHLGPMEFVVPLGMNTRVRDQYISIMKYYHRSIEDSQKERISDDVLDRIRLMLDRLNRVTTHMDLDNGDETSQEDVPAENLAMWAINCSEKFRFLHHLFDALRNRNLHLAIVAKAGQLLDVVETFLKGNHVAYIRPDILSKSNPKHVKSRLEVTLLPSGTEGSTSLPGGANLVIALDGSFSAHDAQVMKLRTHVTNVGQLAPVIHLLVYNSAEHIDRCISTTLESVDRMRRIVSCLTQAGDEVGQLLPDETSAPAAAEEVAAFVEAGGLAHDWTFPAIRPIEDIVAIEYTQGMDALTQPGPASAQRVIAPSTALKRALGSEEAGASPGKRQRITPAAEVTHISDSATQDSQSTIFDLRSSLQEAKAETTSLKTTHTQRESALQASITTTKHRLQEHIDALSALQDRFEQRTHTLTSLRQERDALTAAATASERKREANAAEILSLKGSLSALEVSLKQARDSLLASSIPGVAESERTSAEIRRLQALNADYEKRIASMRTDFDFTRTAYQNASSLAADSALQIRTLESELADLRTKASSNAIDLAEKNKNTENKALLKQTARLEAILAEREDVLRRKEEEIRELRRGRGIGTRGSSVLPGGSPRGSRGASPVAGEAMLRVGSKGLGSSLRYGTKGSGVRGEDDA